VSLLLVPGVGVTDATVRVLLPCGGVAVVRPASLHIVYYDQEGGDVVERARRLYQAMVEARRTGGGSGGVQRPRPG